MVLSVYNQAPEEDLDDLIINDEYDDDDYYCGIIHLKVLDESSKSIIAMEAALKDTESLESLLQFVRGNRFQILHIKSGKQVNDYHGVLPLILHTLFDQDEFSELEISQSFPRSLADTLCHNFERSTTTLRRLAVRMKEGGGKDFDEYSASAIACGLDNCKTLETLELEGLFFSEKVVSTIGDALVKSSTLKHLKLVWPSDCYCSIPDSSRHAFEDEDAQRYLAAAIRKNQSLERFTTDWLNEGFLFLLEALSEKPEIHKEVPTICCSHPDLHMVVDLVTPMLQSNSWVGSLSFEFRKEENPAVIAGMEPFFHALEKNTTMKG
jgi:hypothetical protein